MRGRGPWEERNHMPSDRPNGESGSDEAQPEEVLELQELEEELCRLGGVLAVRVVGDRLGRPTEVHVLSDNSKPAKQTVRDVRAVAQTVFGLELDHRIVSVAQFDANDSDEHAHGAPARTETRVRVASVRFDSETVRATAQVVLADGDREQTGHAEGSVAAIGRPQLVAAATLDALRQLEPAAGAVHLSAADVTRVGKYRIALVTVVWVEPPLELAVSGSAVVRRDRDDAVARALLDATNRRISRLESGRVAR
ncbi:MAG: hypothetical protein WD271_03440 [Acidimicrobiia bacterium]